MATGFTNYLGGKIIDHILRNQAFTPPTTVYVGLATSTPSRTAAGTEVTGGSYARVSVALDAAANGVSQNTSTLTWPTATADWGTVTHVELWDALTTGNRLWFGPLAVSRNITNGTTFSMAAADLDLDAAITA